MMITRDSSAGLVKIYRVNRRGKPPNRHFQYICEDWKHDPAWDLGGGHRIELG
jgi:hypothetical protein